MAAKDVVLIRGIVLLLYLFSSFFFSSILRLGRMRKNFPSFKRDVLGRRKIFLKKQKKRRGGSVRQKNKKKIIYSEETALYDQTFII